MQLKFKFWDEKEKKMYEHTPNFAVGCTGEVSVLKYQACDYVEWEGTEYSKHIKPILWTGIKDKNGKEICEGDILNDVESNMKAEVKFGQYSDCLDLETIGFYLVVHGHNVPIMIDTENIEIIGNIYENPELLEG